MKCIRVLSGVVLSLLTIGLRSVGAQTTHEHAHVRAAQHHIEVRHAKAAPTVDGVISPEEWQDAAVIDSFTQQEPDEGAPASERTEVRLLYDPQRLYIAVHAFDSSPDAIVATEMRRDSERVLDEDNFQVILDTFRDSRSGYMFVTSPLGAKLEQQIFEEGGGTVRGAQSNINRNWDGVWDAKARRTADGWAAEIAIPMVTVRSPEVGTQTWGINFMRNIRRKNEQVYWAPIPKPHALTRVSLAGTITGMTGITRGLDLRVKPFAIAGGRRDRTGDLVAAKGLRDAGLDVKYGLGSGLALDLTVNTDFAQAEVDEQQVNLTRFALFFPEKRDFFLENSGQFTVGAQSTDRTVDLFFSRSIGLSLDGQPVPIIGGARLTGKMAGHNIAVMDIQTDSAYGRPGENLLVARYSRDVLRRSKIGGLLINKEAMNSGRFNRTFAADATFTPTSSFTVQTFVARTSTPGVTEDQGAFYARAGFLDTKWNTYGEFTDIDDGFNAEVGFVPRTGIRISKFHIERNPRPGGIIRVMEPMFNITYTTDQNNRLLTRRTHHMVGTRFQNGAFLNFVYNRWFDQLDEPFEIRRSIFIPAGAYHFHEWNFAFNSNPSRRLYQRVGYSPQTFYGGTRKDFDLTLGLRASSRTSSEISYQRNDVDLPAGDFVVNLAILRFDYALSPRMTIRSLSQYNSFSRQFSTSVRYNFIYRPGSDFYLVYDEFDASPRGRAEVRNRQLIAKFTYLIVR